MTQDRTGDKVLADEIFEYILTALESGSSIKMVRAEVEAAYRLFLRIHPNVDTAS